MKQQKTKTPLSQGLNFEDFKWCIENDFQVYLVLLSEKNVSTGKFKIAVRRGGITTEGKEGMIVNGRPFKSKETLSELTFDNQKDASDHINYVYRHLRRKYG